MFFIMVVTDFCPSTHTTINVYKIVVQGSTIPDKLNCGNALHGGGNGRVADQYLDLLGHFSAGVDPMALEFAKDCIECALIVLKMYSSILHICNFDSDKLLNIH
jgi:hypothetical protein